MKSLKIILPIAVCVFFITGITTRNIRLEAERHLKKEELITEARNRQILSQQKAISDFEDERRRAREDREFKRFLGLRE